MPDVTDLPVSPSTFKRIAKRTALVAVAAVVGTAIAYKLKGNKEAETQA